MLQFRIRTIAHAHRVTSMYTHVHVRVYVHTCTQTFTRAYTDMIPQMISNVTTARACAIKVWVI